MKRKCKLMRVSGGYRYECNDDSSLHPASGDWEELTDREFYHLRDNLYKCNQKMEERIVLVEYGEDVTNYVYASIKEFNDKVIAQEKKEKEYKKANEKTRKAASLERKKKQLAKLKKELGDD